MEHCSYLIAQQLTHSQVSQTAQRTTEWRNHLPPHPVKPIVIWVSLHQHMKAPFV